MDGVSNGNKEGSTALKSTYSQIVLITYILFKLEFLFLTSSFITINMPVLRIDQTLG